MIKMKKLHVILIAVVAVLIVIVVLSLLFLPMIFRSSGRVSMREASLDWEYNNLDNSYYVSRVNVTLANNMTDQIFNLYVEAKGNWPIEYENQKGFYFGVGAGLNPGETRTVSDTSLNNWYLSSAKTKQPGTYTVTFQVVKYKYNDATIRQVEDVYGELTITTTIEPHPTVSGTIADFPGLWINIDAATGGITKVEIQAVSNGLSIHPWGSCTPTDCDWGARTFQVNTNPFTITWTESFCIRTQTYSHLSNGRLHIHCLTHYTDWSGRVDTEEDYYFQKSV